jgi:phospholipid/cholesterol/gamma-HCH transport system substrate-binding protein
MAATTHVKLGLLALATLAGAVAIAFALGIRGLRTDVVPYHAYFDESVQGLEIGSPVKYRGVRIGSVSAVQIAPDRKHVDVTLALGTRDARRLGIADQTPGLFAQLAIQGITGVKFVDLDFFATDQQPTALPFPTAERTLPTRSSLMKGLGDNLEAVGSRLPELADRTITTMTKLDRVLDELHDQHLPARIGTAIADVDATVLDLRRLIASVERAQLPEKTARTVDELRTTIASGKTLVDKLEAQIGVVESMRRAFDAAGDLGVKAGRTPEQLERTLRDLDRAATAVREFFDALDRDPDMLVKGRARRQP